MSIKIFTDSTADLGEKLTSKYAIQVIPLFVHFHDRVFRDGVDITPTELFDRVKQSGELPKTSAPSVTDFTEAFQQGDEFVYLSISSMLSASYQSALIAANAREVDCVRVIDSMNLSTGIGLLALRAAEMRDQGASLDQIDKEINAARTKVRSMFALETLDYLYMGGRCTALQSIFGSLLKIRPILYVKEDGTIAIKEKTRGTRKKAFAVMLDQLKADLPKLDRRRIFITHTNSIADAEFLSHQVRMIADPDEIFITTAGSVIASHCGPETIGILYMLK